MCTFRIDHTVYSMRFQCVLIYSKWEPNCSVLLDSMETWHNLLRATRMCKYPWSIFNGIELWSGGIDEHESPVLLGTSLFLRLPPCCWWLLLNNLFSFAHTNKHTHTYIRVVITFSQMLINYDSITVRVESKTTFHPFSNELWSPTKVKHTADCVWECYTA